MDTKSKSTVENTGDVCPVCNKPIEQGDLRARDNLNRLIEEDCRQQAEDVATPPLPEDFIREALRAATPPQFKTKRYNVMFALRDKCAGNLQSVLCDEWGVNETQSFTLLDWRYGISEKLAYDVEQVGEDLVSFTYSPRYISKDDVLEFLKCVKNAVRENWDTTRSAADKMHKDLDTPICPRCGRDDGEHDPACGCEFLTDDQVREVIHAYKYPCLHPSPVVLPGDELPF